MHEVKANNDEIRKEMSDALLSNYNRTFPLYHTRVKIQKYSRFLDGVVHEVFMSELEEQAGLSVTLEGCTDFLLSSLMQDCDYYNPLMDPIVGTFTTLCRNRKENGIYYVDFKPYCNKRRDDM